MRKQAPLATTERNATVPMRDSNVGRDPGGWVAGTDNDPLEPFARLLPRSVTLMGAYGVADAEAPQGFLALRKGPSNRSDRRFCARVS